MAILLLNAGGCCIKCGGCDRIATDRFCSIGSWSCLAGRVNHFHLNSARSAPGTYVETTNFLGKAIILRSTDSSAGAVVVATPQHGPFQIAAASAIRAGIQPGELPASVGVAEVREALVADHASGKADQGAKVVRHAKFVTFQMAEVALPRELFAAILSQGTVEVSWVAK